MYSIVWGYTDIFTQNACAAGVKCQFLALSVWMPGHATPTVVNWKWHYRRKAWTVSESMARQLLIRRKSKVFRHWMFHFHCFGGVSWSSYMFLLFSGFPSTVFSFGLVPSSQESSEKCHWSLIGWIFGWSPVTRVLVSRLVVVLCMVRRTPVVDWKKSVPKQMVNDGDFLM